MLQPRRIPRHTTLVEVFKMVLLTNATARKFVDWTPSTAISKQVDALPKTLAAKFPGASDASVSASNSAKRAVFSGFEKGVEWNQWVGTASVFAPAASRRAIVLPYVGHLFVPQSAVYAVGAELGTMLTDKVVDRLLKGANERNSQVERAIAVGIKVGALFFLEVPRLAVTSLRVGAALVLGGAGAALGLGYYALMATANALRGRGNTVNTAGEAAATVSDAAQNGAGKVAGDVKEAASDVADKAKDTASEVKAEAKSTADTVTDKAEKATEAAETKVDELDKKAS